MTIYLKYRDRAILYCLYTIMLAGTCLLFLNHAAPNPAGRWFASNTIDLTQSGQAFGNDAEIILSRDLGIPQNDSTNGERVCFCNRNAETPPGRCNICEVNSADISNYHIPDFVNRSLIIDSKAVSTFGIDAQIQSFIDVANQSNRPLWIYVRQDTSYSQATRAEIQATGGDIVRYFVADGDGYFMLVEQSLNYVIIFALVIAGAVMVWQFIVVRNQDIPPRDEYLHDDIDNAEESIEDTEEYMRRMERLSKRTIKKDDDEDRKK